MKMTGQDGTTISGYEAVKVFTASKVRERREMGEVVTSWVRDLERSGGRVVEAVVAQSSDREFHCYTIVMFYRRGRKRRRRR